jgi:alpha,alpha-trehalose-phosphate synthase [UDP-forming]
MHPSILGGEMRAEGLLELSVPQRTQSVSIDRRILPDRLLVASNRLPYKITVDEDQVDLERGAGGLVTALDPVLRYTGGLWFGWTGDYGPTPSGIQVAERMEEEAGDYELRPVRLSEEEIDRYYLGYSNKSLWPLFHYFQEHCEFNDSNWDAYVDVNRKFAENMIDEYREGDFIWIHDYHLMLAPKMIRDELPNANIGVFQHIPFPAPELFEVDLHAREILEGLLGADLIGLHTPGYVRNLIRAVAELTDWRYSISGGWVRSGKRYVRVGSFPISIDCGQFIEMSERPGIDDEIRSIRDYYNAEILAVGVDRLDYTKGILERLQAIEKMLESHPDIQGKFTFIQLSAPSRTKVHAYQELREQVEQMVGRINGRFGGRGCMPVDYRYEEHTQEQLVAYYRAADMAIVTPLRDGMNLVAKEYVVSRVDGGGSLVLSSFTGARRELRAATLVNPYHPQATAEKIYKAIRQPETMKRKAMQRMRDVVLSNDIYWWLEQFLRAQKGACRERFHGEEDSS